MKPLKEIAITLLCFGLSLTERFTHTSIPLVIKNFGLSSFEQSAYFTSLAASMVFTGLVAAPYIDTPVRSCYLNCVGGLVVIASLSFLMFRTTQAAGWGCLMMFCTGALLRIINLRRLSIINSEVAGKKRSFTHTRMQLTIVIAMAVAPVGLAVLGPDNYLDAVIVSLLSCCVLGVCTCQMPVTFLTSTRTVCDTYERQDVLAAHYFIFAGMLLSGVFISNLLTYCHSVSETPNQLYSYVVFWQVVGLIVGSLVFQRVLGERFKNYGVLIWLIIILESSYIFVSDSVLICVISFVISFLFQLMFLKSHNQFQRQIPFGLTAKLNGVRGVYTFAGLVTGYILGPAMFKLGGVELVFLTCSVVSVLFLISLKHLNAVKDI